MLSVFLILVAMMAATSADMTGSRRARIPGLPPGPDVRSLKSLKGVAAWITYVPADMKKVGLTQHQLRADVEQRLRQRGIEVYPFTSYDDAPEQWKRQGQPSLVIECPVIWKDLDHNRLVFAVHTRLYQQCTLVRSPKVQVTSPTWQAPMWAGQGTAEEFRKVVLWHADQFAEAYHTAQKLQDLPQP